MPHPWQAKLNDTAATCEAGPTYQRHSRAKEYSCAFKDQGIIGLLGPTTRFQCSTVKPDIQRAPGGLGVEPPA